MAELLPHGVSPSQGLAEGCGPLGQVRDLPLCKLSNGEQTGCRVKRFIQRSLHLLKKKKNWLQIIALDQAHAKTSFRKSPCTVLDLCFPQGSVVSTSDSLSGEMCRRMIWL